MLNLNRQRGVTLLELMIVVGVIAIIAAIALPAYGRYTYRARRVDAREALMRVAAAQERYYTNFNRYAPDPISGAGSLGVEATSEKNFYKITTKNGGTGDAQSYILEAAPQGAQSTDYCGTLSLNSNGTKLPAATDVNANKNGTCW